MGSEDQQLIWAVVGYKCEVLHSMQRIRNYTSLFLVEKGEKYRRVLRIESPTNYIEDNSFEFFSLIGVQFSYIYQMRILILNI